MFSRAIEILQQIQTDITAPVTNILPSIKINLDEPIDPIYEDLPLIAIYPVKETFDLQESAGTETYKHLFLRIEIRLLGIPASLVATPIVNAISSAIQADQFLGGLAVYVELGDINWASDRVAKGNICGASLDIQVDYYSQ